MNSVIDIVLNPDDLDFSKSGGLVTVVAQDAVTGAVLMVAHMDRDALNRTIETGDMHYRSRTRGLWHKGATSGNVQRVVSLTSDCDGDAILALVVPAGPACHNGTVSCFDGAASGDALSALAATIELRTQDAQHTSSYTRRLLEDRNLRLKKLGEETAELLVALADEDRERATEEGADLLYHMLVALSAESVTLDDVRRVLARRTT
ncbi:MAG: bifunctional phosphoribosyl-AMP cyclohydrolase/phosphoribosyl-ATP diphosphatase HisIE [Gemmatimonadaceae bacterium]